MVLRKRLPRFIVGLALIAIPLGLLSLAIVLGNEFAQVRNLRLAVDNSVTTRAALANLLSENLDIETATRGYAISERRDFLEPYFSALTREPATLTLLDASAANKPDLKRRLPSLKVLARQKREHAARLVSLIDHGRGTEARALVASGAGKVIMDRLRAEISAADRVEAAKLSRMTDSREGSRISVERIAYLLLTMSALLLAFVAALTGRTIRQRQKALAEVRALNARQQAIFDGAVDGMLVLDHDGGICELNPSITRLFGYAESELVGRHNTVLIEDAPDIEASQAWLRQVPPAGAGRAGQRREFIGRRKDGSTFPTDVAISRFADVGEPFYIAVIRDITHRKRVEAMKTEFVSTVSHELRTPLTSIGGSLGLLASGAVGQLNDKAARLVSIAHTNCERLVRLINDILDIEKIESGNMAFDMRRLQVAPLVQRTVGANRGFAEGHRVSLTMHVTPWPQFVMGDPDRLEQVLTNLVSNAIKHSPEGGEVEVWCEQRATMARIEVRDRGPGVPHGFRDRIFGRFAMADSSDSRTRGGTGLGLAIAREIAERHGGTVDFADRQGGGTVFFLELPMSEEAPMTIQRHATELPLLLHVDDDQDCLNVVASAFEGRADVVSFGSLDSARYALERHEFAAAIIDVGMGSENGLDLVEPLRAIKPAIPIILFTAIEENYGSARVDAVLVKSRTPLDRLIETVMELIAQQSGAAA
jgi:PAS domain S-box-containing protein